jgi:hypothetical protein
MGHPTHASQRMVNEHCLQCLVERFSIVYVFFSLRLPFVCGLLAPIRPAAQIRKVEVGLKTFFIRSTYPADEESIIFLGLPAVARCPELAAGQVNNTGSKTYTKCFPRSRP